MILIEESGILVKMRVLKFNAVHNVNSICKEFSA